MWLRKGASLTALNNKSVKVFCACVIAIFFLKETHILTLNVIFVSVTMSVMTRVPYILPELVFRVNITVLKIMVVSQWKEFSYFANYRRARNIVHSSDWHRVLFLYSYSIRISYDYRVRYPSLETLQRQLHYSVYFWHIDTRTQIFSSLIEYSCSSGSKPSGEMWTQKNIVDMCWKVSWCFWITKKKKKKSYAYILTLIFVAWSIHFLDIV